MGVFRLDWDMDETIGNYPIKLYAGDNEWDMRNEATALILGSDFENMSVQMGYPADSLDNDANIVSDFILKDLYPNHQYPADC